MSAFQKHVYRGVGVAIVLMLTGLTSPAQVFAPMKPLPSPSRPVIKSPVQQGQPPHPQTLSPQNLRFPQAGSASSNRGMLPPFPNTSQPYRNAPQANQSMAPALPPVGITDNVLIILDSSLSMEEPLPTGESKMVAAKRVILEALQKLPANVQVGLRIYGNSSNMFTACQATKLLVPLGTNNRYMISSRLLPVRPTGATPISNTLLTAIRQDFPPGPGKKRIILVSDGEETCDADPCSVAVEMVRQGVDVKIDVVGLGLYDHAAVKQLKCVALSTLGKFYQADTAASLAKGVTEALIPDATVEGKIIIPNR